MTDSVSVIMVSGRKRVVKSFFAGNAKIVASHGHVTLYDEAGSVPRDAERPMRGDPTRSVGTRKRVGWRRTDFRIRPEKLDGFGNPSYLTNRMFRTTQTVGVICRPRRPRSPTTSRYPPRRALVSSIGRAPTPSCRLRGL